MCTHPYIHAQGQWTDEELAPVIRAIEAFESSDASPHRPIEQLAGKPWICVRKSASDPVYMAQRLGLSTVVSAFSPVDLAAKIKTLMLSSRRVPSSSGPVPEADRTPAADQPTTARRRAAAPDRCRRTRDYSTGATAAPTRRGPAQ